MWQRIQTVFLAVAVIALLSSLVLPIWTMEINGEANVLTAFYYLKGDSYHYNPYSLTAILAIAAATLAVTEITKYRNRLTQMKLGALNSLFLMGTIGSAAYFATQLIKTLESGGQYGFGLWLPCVAVVCNLLANRFIRKDEKLVRDSERLR
jgi:type II secretory pathway component PulF